MSVQGILTVTAVGRVKDTPEMRQSKAGKPWASIWLECPKRLAFGQRKGEIVNLGCRLKLFGERAADFCRLVPAGAVVAVTGEPQADAYMPQGGQEPRATLEIRVETFAVVSGGYERQSGGYGGHPRRGEQRGGYGDNQYARDDARRQDGAYSQGTGGDDADIPF